MSNLQVKIENIGGLEGSHSFNFTEGLNVIHAPNASGKTSLLKALRLTIPDNNENLGDYLTDGRSRGTVEISDGIKQKVTLNRSSSGVSYGTKNVEFNDEKARRLAFLMEDSPLMEAVREGNSNKIAKWFKTITDIQYYEQARDEVSSLLTEYQTEKNNKERQLSGNKAQVKKNLRDTRSRIEQVEGDINELKKDPEFQKVKSKYEDLEERLDDINRELTRVTSEIESHKEDIESREKRLKSRKRELKEAKRALSDLKEEKEALENRRDELEEERKELKHEIEKLEIKEKNISDKRDELDKKIGKYNNLEGKSTCPTCMRPLEGVDVKNLIQESKKELEKVEKKENELDKKINDLVSERREITEKLERLDTELMEDIKDKKEEISSLRSSITQTNNKIENSKEKLDNLRPEKKDLEERQSEVSRKLKEVDFENEELKERMNSLQAKRENLLDRERELESELKKLKRGTIEIRRLEKKIEKTDEILEHISSRVDEINERVRSEINEGLKNNFELLELAEFQEIGIVRDSFDVNLVRANGERTSLEELSGAERRLVALIMMAVTKKSFYPEVPFMVIDEIANSMDDTRFERVIKWLSEELDTVIVSRNAPFKEKEILQQKHIKNTVKAL